MKPLAAIAPVAILFFGLGESGAASSAGGKTGRTCPLALAAYQAADQAILLEFRGDDARSFRVVVDGLDTTLDGFVFPDETGEGELGVVLDNCPEGDVTGNDLSQCRIWQGPMLASDADGATSPLPGHDQPASPRVVMQGLDEALTQSALFEEAGLPAIEFEHLSLYACQE